MKKVRYFIPAILFYLLIFALSSQNYNIDLPGRWLDKVAHFIEFLFLGFFLSVGYFNAFRFSAAVKSVLVFVTGLPLGILDEIHQLFVPGRTSAIGDVIADSAGIIWGILVYLYLARRRRGARETRPA
jgi:VanZ family protein